MLDSFQMFSRSLSFFIFLEFSRHIRHLAQETNSNVKKNDDDDDDDGDDENTFR